MTIGSALSRGAPEFALRSECLVGTCAPREKPCRPPVGSRAEKSAGTGARQARRAGPGKEDEDEGGHTETLRRYRLGGGVLPGLPHGPRGPRLERALGQAFG